MDSDIYTSIIQGYELDCADMSRLSGGLRGRMFADQFLVNYEDVDFEGCVLYGCYPKVGRGALEINPCVDFTQLNLTTHLRDRAFNSGSLSFEGKDFSHANFSGLICGQNEDFDTLEFVDCDLVGANFNKTILDDFVFKGCDLEGATFRQSKIAYNQPNKFYTSLHFVGFNDSNLTLTDFSGSTLGNFTYELAFFDCNLFEADFDHSKLINNEFSQCYLAETSFKNSTLRGVEFSEVQLFGADFENSEFLRRVVFDESVYDTSTVFPKLFDPDAHGLTYVDTDDDDDSYDEF